MLSASFLLSLHDKSLQALSLDFSSLFFKANSLLEWQEFKICNVELRKMRKLPEKGMSFN